MARAMKVVWVVIMMALVVGCMAGMAEAIRGKALWDNPLCDVATCTGDDCPFFLKCKAMGTCGDNLGYCAY